MKKIILVLIPVVMVAGGVVFLKQTKQNSELSEPTPTLTNNPATTPIPEDLPLVTTNENSAVPLPINESLINQALDDYLPQRILEPAYDGRIFCAHHLYGFDKDETTNLIYAYVWAYCEEYNLVNGEIEMGSGSSLPDLVSLKVHQGKLGVHGHNAPQDGHGYAQSIKEMFPAQYADQAIEGYPVKNLSPSPLEQAKIAYGD